MLNIDNDFQDFFDDEELDNDNALFDEKDELFELLKESSVLENFIESLTLDVEETLENEDVNILERYSQQNDDSNFDTFVFNESLDDKMIFESDSILDEFISTNIFETDDGI